MLNPWSNRNYHSLLVKMHNEFPGGSNSKESACNVGNSGSALGSGRSPREGNSYPFQYSCLENPHGQRDLVGYSPWGCKESDTTEWITHRHFGRQFGGFFQKSIYSYHKIQKPLGIYPKKLKMYIHTKTWPWTFTAALFVIAKMWKQPKYPSVGEWIIWL